MKIYKIKLNEKVYEVQLEEVTETSGSISTPVSTQASAPKAAAPAGGEKVSAPMPGTMFDIKVKVGDQIEEGDLVAVLEAMKMETEIFSHCAGTVTEVHVDKGASVNLGDAIVSLA